jgi:hypothetical protein
MISISLLTQPSLYGCGCEEVKKLSFLTASSKIMFSQLPESMMTLHFFPLMEH